MKTEQEYIRDLTEIRSMMERSTKFLSLTGLSGVLAGIYALAGAYLAHSYFSFDSISGNLRYTGTREIAGEVINLILLAVAVLILAIGTAVVLSYRKSRKSGESIWNPAARRLVVNMLLPLFTGGIFILILFSKGLIALAAPASLIFYGLALMNAGNFTFQELKSLGIVQVLLGLIAAYFLNYALIFWALGFGVMHILYGIYMHLKYEK